MGELYSLYCFMSNDSHNDSFDNIQWESHSAFSMKADQVIPAAEKKYGWSKIILWCSLPGYKAYIKPFCLVYGLHQTWAGMAIELRILFLPYYVYDLHNQSASEWSDVLVYTLTCMLRVIYTINAIVVYLLNGRFALMKRHSRKSSYD